MKVISPIFSEMRGTLGGAVGSVARGGINYFRARVIPTNPSSLLQTAIRQAVQSVSSLWKTVLTEEQWAAWFDIAEGAQTGKSLFAKVNQPRVYAANTGRMIDDTGSPVGALHIPYFASPPDGSLNVPFHPDAPPVIDASANTLDINTVEAGDWNAGADATHEAMVYVYVSGPQSASRLSRQRPYQLLAAYATNDPADVDFTAFSLAAFGIPVIEGAVFYVKLYAQDIEGRLSLPLEYRVEVVA